MCPFCFGTVGLVLAGTISTSALAALAMKISREKNKTAELSSNESTGATNNDNADS
jgi:hypothetical protein